MGREVEKRTRRFNLNLTETEHKKLLASAREAGFTPQKYVRSLFVSKSSLAAVQKDARMHKGDELQSDSELTKEDLEHRKQLLEIELDVKAKELKFWEKVVELQNMKWEISLMELEEEKKRVKKEIDVKKMVQRFTGYGTR